MDKNKISYKIRTNKDTIWVFFATLAIIFLFSIAWDIATIAQDMHTLAK